MLKYVLFVVVSLILMSSSGFAEDGIITETKLGLSKVVAMPFDEALQKVKKELKNEGFGILTEVDVKATMKSKLDIDYRPYHILGACNPPLAHKALQAEEQVGLLLPCKVIVYVDQKDRTVVAIVDPVKMMQDLDNDNLGEVAKTVLDKFKKVLMSI